MYWTVDFHPAFAEEFGEMNEAVQDRLLISTELLREFGPALGRPHADTLNGSKYRNMFDGLPNSLAPMPTGSATDSPSIRSKLTEH